MAKLKTPLLSFRAEGTIGKAVTFARVKGATIAKKIPSHPDARTLPQLYQRWRFTDARYYWASLSAAQRAAYKASAVGLNMSGWNLFLRTYLAAPLDQVLWLHLDGKHGALAPDYSSKDNHGAIFGAIPATGVIDGAYDFDGLDDYVDCGSDPTLDISAALTLMAWLNLHTYTAGGGTTDRCTIITKVGAYYMTVTSATGKLACYLSGAHPVHTDSNSQVPLNQWAHVAITYDGAALRWYLNGLLDKTSPETGAITIDARFLYLAAEAGAIRILNGLIDDSRTYNRALSPAQILEIATTQRYPSGLL